MGRRRQGRSRCWSSSQPEGMDNMPDGAEELSSTVSLFRVADNSITSNELEDIITVEKIVNELGLFSFLPNISAIVVHEGQHAKEELIL